MQHKKSQHEGQLLWCGGGNVKCPPDGTSSQNQKLRSFEFLVASRLD
jgi:hypothetical protein